MRTWARRCGWGAAASLLLTVVVGASPAQASYPRYDLWQSPAGAVKCRVVFDGADGGRGTLECLVVARGLLVRWGSATLPKVTAATSTQKARFANAPRVRYSSGPSFRMGSRSYYCGVSSTYGTFCSRILSDGAPTLNLHSGIIDFRFMTGNPYGVKHYRWAGSYWSYRFYPMSVP